MKCIKNILMVVGLFLQVGIGFAASSSQGRRILDRFHKEKNEPTSTSMEYWESNGPTPADILSSKLSPMRVCPEVQVAAKGSLEDQLTSAVKDNDLNNVERLIAAGANLEAGDREDYSNLNALMIAASKGYADIAAKLINAGANVKAETRYGMTVFTYAVQDSYPPYAVHDSHALIVKLLIAKGAAKDQRGFGYHFEYAVANGNDEMVQELMVEGALIDKDTLKRAYSLAQIKCSAKTVSAIKKLQNKANS